VVDVVLMDGERGGERGFFCLGMVACQFEDHP
jgi:hypothetical protein